MTINSNPTAVPASIADVGTSHPADGAQVTITDGERIRRGWIVVETDSADDTGRIWVALSPSDSSEAAWAGQVPPSAVVVEDAPPSWWQPQTSDLMRALVRSVRGQQVLVDDAHKWADENQLCSVFDSFMREHDLPPRSRAYSTHAEVTLTMTLPVGITARHGQSAHTLLTSDVVVRAVRERLGGFRRHGLAIGEYTVGELQEVDA